MTSERIVSKLRRWSLVAICLATQSLLVIDGCLMVSLHRLLGVAMVVSGLAIFTVGPYDLDNDTACARTP